MEHCEPRLTVAVPFYKNAGLLQRTLASVLAQRTPRADVLLVDNSNDEEEHRAALSLAAALPEGALRYVRNDRHLSACENFNRCIDLAQTDLIAIVHADDEVLPCYEEEVLGLAARHPEAAILFFAVRIINAESKPCFSFVDWFKRFLMPRGRGDFVLAGEGALRSLAIGDWINGAAICYRKTRLGDLRWDGNYPMASDLDLWSRAILSDRTMAGTRRPPAYCYRRHAAQTTAALGSNLERFWEESRVLDLIADRAAARGWRSVVRPSQRQTTLQLHLVFLAASDALTGSAARAWRKLSLVRAIRRRASAN